MDLKKLIVEYYVSCKAMQLVTVDGSNPWICTVYYAFDDELNLYWTSGRSRQHSLEIITNPNAAATIVKDIDRKQALQIVGNAYEVADDRLQYVHSLYTSKYGPKEYDLEEMKRHDPGGRAYWVLRPETISLWDEVNFPEAPKQVVNIND